MTIFTPRHEEWDTGSHGHSVGLVGSAEVLKKVDILPVSVGKVSASSLKGDSTYEIGALVSVPESNLPLEHPPLPRRPGLCLIWVDRHQEHAFVWDALKTRRGLSRGRLQKLRGKSRRGDGAARCFSVPHVALQVLDARNTRKPVPSVSHASFFPGRFRPWHRVDRRHVLPVRRHAGTEGWYR